MILSYDDLLLQLKNYTDVAGKIKRELKTGNLIKISRGLYETNAKTNGKYLANRICGPSYLSFEYALAYYSLIPEAVYKTYTSATFHKRKKKKFENSFGVFSYTDVPKCVYPLGILLKEEDGYSYQIASPEKALCDELYSLPPVANAKELNETLFENLRIDESAFFQLNTIHLLELVPLYRSTNLKLLAKLIKKEK